MKLTLKQAVRSAERGCLDDREDVARVLDCLMAAPARELPREYTADLKGMLACGLHWLENVSDEEFGEYTYLDLICLSYFTFVSLFNEDPDAQPSLLLLAEQIFLKFIQKTENYCTWTSLFCWLNLEELLNILDEKAGLPHNSFNELIRLTRRIECESYSYNLNARSTVKDLADQTERIIKQYWCPWENIRDYTFDVTTGYEVISTVVFGCILRAYKNVLRTWETDLKLKGCI